MPADSTGSLRPRDVQALVAAVLDSAGETASDLRRGLATGGEVPADLAVYADKVLRHAYKVTEKDLVILRQAGYSENAIFEVTLSLALGAALARLDAGLRALEGDRR